MIELQVRRYSPTFCLEHDWRVRRRNPSQELELLVGQRAARWVVPELETLAVDLADAGADRPVTKTLAGKWLRRAEALAKLERQEGSAFHAYRRGWATARKHLPLPDVAAAGGWKGTVALQRSYLHADEQTMLTVVLSGAELRDVKKA